MKRNNNITEECEVLTRAERLVERWVLSLRPLGVVHYRTQARTLLPILWMFLVFPFTSSPGCRIDSRSPSSRHLTGSLCRQVSHRSQVPWTGEQRGFELRRPACTCISRPGTHTLPIPRFRGLSWESETWRAGRALCSAAFYRKDSVFCGVWCLDPNPCEY